MSSDHGHGNADEPHHPTNNTGERPPPGDSKGTKRLRKGFGIFAVIVLLAAIPAGLVIATIVSGGDEEEKSSSPAHAPAAASVAVKTEPAVERCAALGQKRLTAPPVRNAADPNDPVNWTELVPGEPGCTIYSSQRASFRIQCLNMQGEFVDYNTTACAQGMGERYGSRSRNPMPVTVEYKPT